MLHGAKRRRALPESHQLAVTHVDKRESTVLAWTAGDSSPFVTVLPRGLAIATDSTPFCRFGSGCIMSTACEQPSQTTILFPHNDLKLRRQRRHNPNLCCHPEEILSSPILKWKSENMELYTARSVFNDVWFQWTCERKDLVYYTHHCR